MPQIPPCRGRLIASCQRSHQWQGSWSEGLGPSPPSQTCLVLHIFPVRGRSNRPQRMESPALAAERQATESPRRPSRSTAQLAIAYRTPGGSRANMPARWGPHKTRLASYGSAKFGATYLGYARRAFALVGPRGGMGGSYAPARFSRRSTVVRDRKSTRLNSSHVEISYAVFCLK